MAAKILSRFHATLRWIGGLLLQPIFQGSTYEAASDNSNLINYVELYIIKFVIGYRNHFVM